MVSQGTVDVNFVINGVPKGLVAQQDRSHKWTNYKGSEIKYLSTPLLEAGGKNVQAEIAVGANNISSFKKTLSLNKDTKFNPFIGLYALHIDPSSLPWAKISGVNPPGTMEQITVSIKDANSRTVKRIR